MKMCMKHTDEILHGAVCHDMEGRSEMRIGKVVGGIYAISLLLLGLPTRRAQPPFYHQSSNLPMGILSINKPPNRHGGYKL